MWHHQTIHFPIALILVGAVFALAALSTRRESIELLARVFLWLGAGSLIVAVGAGLWVQDQFGDARIPTHRNWGLGALAAGLLALGFDLAQRRWAALRWGRAVAFVAAAILIVITGRLGGEMGHGEDAPPPAERRTPSKDTSDSSGDIVLPAPGRVSPRRRSADPDAPIVLPPPGRIPRRVPPGKSTKKPSDDAGQ